MVCCSLGSNELSVLLLLSSTKSVKCLGDCAAAAAARRMGRGEILSIELLDGPAASCGRSSSTTSSALSDSRKCKSTARCSDPPACTSKSRRRVEDTPGPTMSLSCSSLSLSSSVEAISVGDLYDALGTVPTRFPRNSVSWRSHCTLCCATARSLHALQS